MQDVLNQAMQYVNGAAGLLVFVFALIGLALTYAGLKVYWLIVFLIGMIPGALLGIAVGGAMDWPGVGVALFALLCAVLSGVLSIWLTLLSIFLLGGFVGSLLAVAMGAQEPVVIIIAGIICGALFIWLHQAAIIIGTSFSGAGFLTYSAVNAVSMLRHGHPAYLPGDYIAKVAYIGRTASRGGLEAVYRGYGSSLLVFLFFFVTGLIVQFNFHKIFGGSAKQKSSGKGLSTPGESVRTAISEEKDAVAAPATASSIITHPAAVVDSWQMALFQDGVHKQTLMLPQGNYLLGSGEGVDIPVVNDAVSDQHLKISVCPLGRLTLNDLDSSSGTWKSGTVKIREDSPESGHWYQMGTMQIVFQQG